MVHPSSEHDVTVSTLEVGSALEVGLVAEVVVKVVQPSSEQDVTVSTVELLASGSAEELVIVVQPSSEHEVMVVTPDEAPLEPLSGRLVEEEPPVELGPAEVIDPFGAELLVRSPDEDIPVFEPGLFVSALESDEVKEVVGEYINSSELELLDVKVSGLKELVYNGGEDVVSVTELLEKFLYCAVAIC